jgi:hypothetical protein
MLQLILCAYGLVAGACVLKGSHCECSRLRSAPIEASQAVASCQSAVWCAALQHGAVWGPCYTCADTADMLYCLAG